MKFMCFGVENGYKYVLLILAVFHQMDLSGLLVCHSRDITKLHTSEKNSIAICLTLGPNYG